MIEKKMNVFCISLLSLSLTLSSLAVFAPTTAYGADDALSTVQAAFTQGDYASAAEALEPLLKREPVSKETLSLAMQVSLKQGEFFTALRRGEALLELPGGKEDAKLLLAIANIANTTEDQVREADVLSLYLTLKGTDAAQRNKVLLRLLEISSNASAAIEYCTKNPVTRENLNLSAQMLNRLFETGQSRAHAELSQILLKKTYNNPELFSIINSTFVEHVGRGVYLAYPGLPLDGSGELPEAMSKEYQRYSKAARILFDAGIFTSDFFNIVRSSQQETPKVFLSLLAKPDAMNEQLLYNIAHSSRWDSRLYPEDIAQQLQKLEPAYRAKKDRRLYLHYLTLLTRHQSQLLQDPMLAHLTKLYADAPETVQALGIVNAMLKHVSYDEFKNLYKKYAKFANRGLMASSISSLPTPEGEDRYATYIKRYQEILGKDYARMAGDGSLDWMCHTTQGVSDQDFYNILAGLAEQFAADAEAARIASALYSNRRPKSITPEKQLELLKKIYDEYGYCRLLAEAKRYVKGWIKANGKEAKNAANMKALQKFVDTLDVNKQGKNPLRSACAKLHLTTVPQSRLVPDATHKMMEETFKRSGNISDPLMLKLIKDYADLCSRNKESQKKCLEILFAKNLGANAPWYEISYCAAGCGDAKLGEATLRKILELKLPADKFYQNVLSHSLPVDTAKPYLFGAYYDKVQPSVLWDSCVKKPSDKLTDKKVALQEVVTYLQKCPKDRIYTSQHDGRAFRDAIYYATSCYLALTKDADERETADAKKLLQPALPLLENLAIKPLNNYESILSTTLSLFQAVGEMPRAQKAYLDAAKAGYSGTQYVQKLIDWGDYLSLSSPEMYDYYTKYVLPELEKLPKDSLAEIMLNDRFYQALNHLISGTKVLDEKEAYLKTRTRYLRLLAEGVSFAIPSRPSTTFDTFFVTVDDLIEAGEYQRALKLAYYAFRAADSTAQRTFLETVRNRGQWQMLYLLANRVPTDSPQSTFSQQIRGIAATRIPGIFPVSSRHPAFQIYLASSELARGNESRARDMLVKNLKHFTADPMRFDANFTIWALERMSAMRGENDGLLRTVRAMIDQILLNEKALDIELAARLLLIRADCVYKLGDLPLAELEYKSLLNSPRYNKTTARTEARFRLVDLDIERGNFSAVAQEIERWLSFADPKMHIEAYYYKAKLAFELEDYDECRKMLNEVFDRRDGHELAGILEGEYRKAKGDLSVTEIRSGEIQIQTQLCPGEDLRLTITDKNLSIIGGNNSIPIVVTTTSGDKESINLYAMPRMPSRFQSSLPTQLGKAMPGNMKLEVNGKDVIRYEIDPAFLKSRNLEPLGIRELTLVDDSWLAASAGELLTEEEQKQERIRQQIESLRDATAGSTEKDDAQRAVRPGNPIYVMIRDRDCDHTDTQDTISVVLTTSSGDKVTADWVKETDEHTGLFEGQIETHLPLPRAYASDTAEGFSASTVISKNKEGLWSSVADSGEDKWFAVDTMDAHKVSQISLKVPEPDTIKRLSLYGIFGENERRLAQFPAVDLVDPASMTHQRQAGTPSKNAEGSEELESIVTKLRNSFEKPEKIDLLTMNQPEKKDFIGRLTGNFYVEKGEPLELAVYTPDLKSQGSKLSFFIMLDGKNVLQVSDWQKVITDNKRITTKLFLSEGAHRIDVYYYQNGAGTRFLVGSVNELAEFAPLPKQWFDIKNNEELAKSLQDPGKLEKTEDGFTVKFSEPQMLRQIRYDFDEYSGAAVKIAGITLTNADGQEKLPVENDFSTTLDNDTLEIAPGDSITVSYSDYVTQRGEIKTETVNLTSGFSDGTLGFSYETEARIGEESTYADAYRFKPGETVTVTVVDSDADYSDRRDEVKLVVRAASGKEVSVTAVEVDDVGNASSKGFHSGVFRAVINTSLEEPTDSSTLQVEATDYLVASYQDSENMSPGVSVVRESAPLNTVSDMKSVITFYRLEHYEDTDEETGKLVMKTRQVPVSEEELNKVDDQGKRQSVVVNAKDPIVFEVYNPSLAIHSESTVLAKMITRSQFAMAKRLGVKDLDKYIRTEEMKVEGGTADQPNSIFVGRVQPVLGVVTLTETEEGEETDEYEEFVKIAQSQQGGGGIPVCGFDEICVMICGKDRKTVERTQMFALATEGTLGIYDRNYQNPIDQLHMGESLYVMVNDADRDVSDQHDQITVAMKASSKDETETLVLTETMPHSGIFTASLRTRYIGEKEETKEAKVEAATETEATETEATETEATETAATETAATETAATEAGEKEKEVKDVGVSTLYLNYGDTVSFTYKETAKLASITEPLKTAEATIQLGADGNIAMFSKQYKDDDNAARVQFRMAECLFEMAKEYRRAKDSKRAADAIDRGRQLLDEAMQDYPNTEHIVQSRYLLANLEHELGNSLGEEDSERANKLYQEAIAGYSEIISTWPDSDHAPQALFGKALCLQKLGDHRKACEEFVRLCYTYEDSSLITDATIRLATHFYRIEKRYDVAGRIYSSYVEKYPNEERAPMVLFLAAQCHYKQAQTWQEIVDADQTSAEDIKKIKQLEGRDIEEAIKYEFAQAGKLFSKVVSEFQTVANSETKAQAHYYAMLSYLSAEMYKEAYVQYFALRSNFSDTVWATKGLEVYTREEKLQAIPAILIDQEEEEK